MTGSIAELFAEVSAGGPSAVAAIDEIAKRGAPAVPDLMGFIERGRGSFIATALLSLLDVPDRVALLAPFATHKEHAIRTAAMGALAMTADARAVPVLAEAGRRGDLVAIRTLGDLGVADGLDPLRLLVEQHVGDLGRPSALADLMKRAVEDSDPGDVFIAVEAAESLAKLGDFAGLRFACELAELSADAFVDADSFRLSAIHALDVMVGPDIAGVLDRRSDDANPEIAEAAMTATMHLGRIRAVERWLAIAAKADSREGAARFCIDELLGDNAPTKPTLFASWWTRKQPKLDPAICYRRGVPATPRTLVVAVRDPDGVIVRRELRQMTGLPFITPSLDPPARAELAAIDAWWAAHSTITPGKLHRWGRTYEPDACD